MCPAGKASLADAATTAYTCTACPSGYAAGVAGSTSCDRCVVGRVSISSGSSHCKTCASGECDADGRCCRPSSSVKETFATGHDTPVYRRERLPVDTPITGPAVIEEDGSTTAVPPTFRTIRRASGALFLERIAP